jgi:amino acid adenylation domain-containing protein
MDRFTQFPVVNDDGDAVHVVPWQIDAQLPAELLAMSWAVLLRAFTTDETPVFLWNGKPVKADFSAQTVLPADLAEVASLSGKHTAVVLGDHPSGQPPVLLWTVDPTMQTGALHATGGMDADFLHQLGQQLKQIVQEQAAGAGMQLVLPASEAPKLSIANSEPATLPGPGLLHELALRGIHDGNHAIEFLAADGNIHCLSYEALDRLSSKLASEIARASTANGASMVVPVLLPQSVELYISWLGILKAGAAFCPLNTDAPPDRIEFILQDVAACVVITQDAFASKIPPKEKLSILTVDNLASNSEPTEPCTTTCTSSNLAYVMYTSGSTGRPKGVGVSHLAATQSLLAHDDLIPPFKRFLQFASPTFDVSVFEVFFPMMRGATLIGSERENMLLDISHVITRMKVDAAELTPTVAGELLRTRAAAPCLRVLLTIGEMLTQHVVDEFGQAEGRDGILHGMYGPTEAAIHCTAATHFQATDRVNMIGKPFKTVSAYIMSLPSDDDPSSKDPQALPLGQIGELVVGGPQLADGYINRPEENGKAFIDSPLYGRLYRTGDKARMLPNADIECFGRISSGQVKLRGQRIELGEIEHVITRTEGVRSAVTIVIGGNLIAFVLVTGQGTTDRAIRNVCRQLLPRFMIPGEFVLVDQFPQLPSGKIDRKTLEADFVHHRGTVQSSDEEPCRDEKEEAIVSSVTDVLGRRLASTESLASVGLDSLGAIRLASHLLDAGIRLDVATLLEADSIDGIWQLSTTLEASGYTEDTQAALQAILQLVSDAGAARTDSLGLTPHVSEVVPCSHIQQAMVLETVRNSTAYCNWIELEFEPSISSASIKHAFVQLAQHNEILRSGFVEIGLKDHSYGRFTWNVIDGHISEQAELDYDVSLGEGQDILHPFRVQIKKGKNGLRALVHIHHGLYDGWSWQLILNDLRDFLLGAEPASRPPYNIVTNFFIEHKLDKSTTESSTYWREQLQGLYPVNFPNFQGKTDVPSTTQQVTRILGISVPKLNEVTQHLRISRQTIFQAALCYLLSSYLGTNDVTFGTVFSGRTLPLKGIDAVLGPCIRTLPTRMNLDKMQDVTDLLLAIQNMNRKSLEHGSVSLQDIKKASGIELDQSLFDTAVVWQESMWSIDQQSSPFQEANAAEFLEFVLLLEFEPRAECVFAKATYLQSVLPVEQAALLLEQIDSVASILIDNVQLPIENIRSLLPLSTLSVQSRSATEQVTLPSLASGVETVASTNPSRVALELMLSGSDLTIPSLGRVTYGELNSRANRLAHHLHHIGITHTDLIAILLRESIDFYIAVLAVAKSGAGLLLIPHATPATVRSALSTTKSKSCVVDSESVHRFELNSVPSVQHIFVSSSMYPCHCENPPTVEEKSDVAYAEITLDGDSTDDVVISRRNLESNIQALSDVYPTPVGSKILSTSPFGSSISIFEIFFAWHAGTTLCSISPEQHIEKAIQDMGITHLHVTPTLASRVDPKSVPNVKYMLTLGEGLTPKVHRDWTERELYHAYSARALTHVCAIYTNVKKSTSLRNIGKPLKNTSAMIAADQELFTLLPRGAIGELWFGGDQVGRSLPNSDSSRAGKFIEHPEYGRLYRTGQFGRLLPDGSILLRERGESNIHAQFIDIDEVDRALLFSAKVRDSVSMILDGCVHGQQRLVTFWIPSQQSVGHVRSEDVANNLLKELGTKLLSSSMPSLIVPIDEVPITRSNKTDHSELRRRVEQMKTEELVMFSPKSISDDSVNGLTELEQTISVALSAVTGAEQNNIRKHTSFYRLGLDSLSAVSFSRKLQEEGCGRLAVSTILRHSSIAQLAAVITLMVNEDQPEQVEVRPSTTVFDETFIHRVEDEFSAAAASVQKIYPCTPLQEAMLAAESSDHSAYFNHLLILVRTDAEAMRAAWAQMMQRHEILRTCFTQTNDKRFAYAQVVLDISVLPWSHVQTSPDNQLENVIKTSKSNFEGISPINGRLPYALTFVTDSAAQKKHLLLSIHHALYDGEGIAQLLNEVQRSLSKKELPITVPFHRFIDYMTSFDYGSSDQYWDQYLSGFSPTLLPAPSADVDESTSRQYHKLLNGSFGSLKQQCKYLSVTPLNIFHTAWARLLSLYTDSPDVTFGNVFSCRTVPIHGADQIVGPCFNTLPIRIKFSSTATNSDIMKLSQKSNSEILPHQLSPLRRIQRRVFGDGSRLFDTLLIFQNSKTDLDSRIWELLHDEGNMGFPLICEIVPNETEDKIQIYVHFQSSHISQAVAETIAAHFTALVEHTIQYPSAQAFDKRPLGINIPRLFEQKVTSTNAMCSLTKSRPTRPWSAHEEAVRDILCKFSDVVSDNMPQDTTIFQLGLDSINAVQISAKLRGLGYKVSSGEILEV